MADPRFFENLGPFSLAQICEKTGIALAAGADGARQVFDVADLSGADGRHLTFFSGTRALRGSFAGSQAGVCLVPLSDKSGKRPDAPAGMTVLGVPSVGRAFAAIAAIIVVQPSVNASLGKALERSTATVIGVAIALGASLAFGSPSWLVLVAIAAAIITGWAFKLTPATANHIST